MTREEQVDRIRTLAHELHPSCFVGCDLIAGRFVVVLHPTLKAERAGERGGRYEADGETYEEFADNMIAVLEAALERKRAA